MCRSHKSLLAKSDDGTPYILPKAAAKSYIYQRIEKEEMPPSSTKVSPAERKILKEWIDSAQRSIPRSSRNGRSSRMAKC